VAAVVIVGRGRTLIESAFAGDVVPAVSLTVTLKLKGLPTALEGVPLIAPLAALSVSPGGSDPVLTVQPR
jgi:hypothetical protein